MDQLIRILTQDRAKMATDIAQRIISFNLPLYRNTPQDTLMAASDRIMGPFIESLGGDRQPYLQACTQVGTQQVERGAAVGDALELFRATEEVIIEHLQSLLKDDPAALAKAQLEALSLLTAGRRAMVESYVSSRERVINDQQDALRELGTPIVPVRQGILVLPIIGGIDSRRAGQIIESALEQITVQQADVLIIDITGVPIVDTGVANYLIQTARAVRLLGAQVILVGISAAIAQAIVSLGIDMSDIRPRANLQSAIELALSEQGLAIQPITADTPASYLATS